MKLHSLGKIQLLALIVGLMTVGLLFASPDKAYANDCGISTGNVHDYAGLVVNVQRVTAGGATIDVNDSAVQVSTVFPIPKSSEPGNIVLLNSTSVTARIPTASFDQFGSGCTAGGGDGTNVVLGYGHTSAQAGGGPAGPWALDCDMSLHPDYPQAFDVTGVGVPAGAAAGGIWEVKTVQPPNGDTTYVTITYFEPGGPSSTADPTGVVDSASCTSIAGWALDADNYNTSIQVHIYQAGTTTGVAVITANVGRSDLNDQPSPPDPIPAGYSNAHGFNWIVPGSLKDGTPRAFDFYAININSNGAIVGSSNTKFAQNVSIGACTQPVDNPPTLSLTPDCSVPQVTIFASDPDPGTAEIRYQINSGAMQSDIAPWPRTLVIPLGSYTGGGPINVQAWTNGVPPGGGTAGAEITVSTVCVDVCPNIAGYQGTVPSGYFVVSSGDCVAVSCGNINTVPGSPEPGEPFTVNFNFTMTAISTGLPYTINFLTPAGITPPATTVSGTAVAGSTTVPVPPASFGPMSAPTAGVYAGYITVSLGGSNFSCAFGTPVPGPPASCPGSCLPGSPAIIIGNKPFFRVYGGDTAAGIPSAAGCNTGWNYDAEASIWAFNDGDGLGAAGQLAANVSEPAAGKGLIRGFTSGTGSTSASGPTGAGGSLLPKYLTFANTVAGTFGGQSNMAYCPPDYQAIKSTPPSVVGSPVDLATLASGTYSRSGDTVINAATLPFGKKLTIYIDGDVRIAGNIQYNVGAGWTIDTIPSLYLIVKGDIYVNPIVTQLDGTFIAQPNGAGGGVFYTCAKSNAFAPPDWATAAAVTACANKLTINGNVMAQRIKLFRLNGTRRLSSINESANSANIAEVFNSGPEVWLSTPAPFQTSSSSGYDSITSLPPIL